MSVTSLLDLRERTAVVAGGGGAIGSAIAARLAECGATVFCLDQPGRTGPDGTTAITCDLTDGQAVTGAIAEVDRRRARLDILVHAAGISRDGRLWKISAEDWQHVIDTNLTSAFHLLRAAVPVMRRGGGAIVLVSSINGERGKVGLSSYAASKAGLNALARTAAREVGAFGIRVNAIAPGWITSPMTDALPADLRQKAIDESALGRMGEPDDVARAAVFLVSDLGRHVTGQVIRVDGGQLIG